MKADLKLLEKLVNAELTSKVTSSKINFNELLIETNPENLLDVILFLKSDDNCRFKQLIDIAGVDYPQEEKRFKLVYLFFGFFYAYSSLVFSVSLPQHVQLFPTV